MRLRLAREWLERQAKHERLILGGNVSPDTYDAAAAHALMQIIETIDDAEVKYWIFVEAGELMKTWGYGE